MNFLELILFLQEELQRDITEEEFAMLKIAFDMGKQAHQSDFLDRLNDISLK